MSEANSPLPTDRVYYSYRHFENATPVSVYQIEEDLNVDRHTLAFEKTYWDGMCSIEVRTPIEERLTSSFISDIRPGGIPFRTERPNPDSRVRESSGSHRRFRRYTAGTPVPASV